MTGDHLTVGVLTPHAAEGPEVELPALTRGRVTAVMSRTRLSGTPTDVGLRLSTDDAAAALRAQGVGRVQLIHPPWFDDEFDELGAAYFRSQGFAGVVTKAVDLPDDPARVDPQGVVDWVEHHAQDRADAIFLAGNGFRASGAVEELERRTGRLVLAANLALLWGILAATGTGWDITGHGRLLRASPS